MTQVFLTIITNTEHPLISDASRSAGRARRGGALPPPGGGCCAQAQALSAALARSSLSNKCGRRFHTAISGEGVALCSLQHGGEWRSRGAGETPFCGRAKGKVEPGLALNSPSPFFSFQVSGELVSVAHALSLPAESYGNDVSMAHPQLLFTPLVRGFCRARHQVVTPAQISSVGTPRPPETTPPHSKLFGPQTQD